MAKKKVGDYILEWMDSFGKENGFEVHRTEFVKEAGTWYLRVYVDRIIDGKYDYMTSDDCEVVSRYLSKCLDDADLISQNYYLEVSSPGMDRPLICDKDFDRFKGSQVEISLYKSLEGSKNLTGELVNKENNIVTIKDQNGNEVNLPLESIAKINLAVVL